MRYRLARLYQDQGDNAKALAQLKQIKDYKTNRVERDIANLENSLSAQKK